MTVYGLKNTTRVTMLSYAMPTVNVIGQGNTYAYAFKIIKKWTKTSGSRKIKTNKDLLWQLAIGIAKGNIWEIFVTLFILSWWP